MRCPNMSIKLKMKFAKAKHKKDIQNECSTISNDIAKVTSEMNSLVKRINVLNKKKDDLQSQMKSIVDVLNTMKQHEHNLQSIASATHVEKDKVDGRIQCITDYNDRVDLLHDMLTHKRAALFGHCDTWDTQEVLNQLMHHLKTQHMTLNALDTIIEQFNARGIKGKDLPNLNELTFNMMNINDEFDQKMLTLWIDQITTATQATTRTPPNKTAENDSATIMECKMELSSPNSPVFASTTSSTAKHLICSVCMVNKVNVILNPCGHICICRQCSAQIGQKCPVCRNKITEIKH
eukprot:204949_1